MIRRCFYFAFVSMEAFAIRRIASINLLATIRSLPVNLTRENVSFFSQEVSTGCSFHPDVKSISTASIAHI
jgi:hypothetical protein